MKRSNNIAMFTSFCCILFAGFVDGAIPPYLSTVIPKSDIAIDLTWNCNSNDGLLIYQKKDGDTGYVIVNIIALGFCTGRGAGEISKLEPKKKYYYKLKGMAQIGNPAHFDTTAFSNIDSATTLEPDSIFKSPAVFWTWDSTTKFAITIMDSSTVEKGYRISIVSPYSAFSYSFDTTSSNPSIRNHEIVLSPTGLAMNNWYISRVVVYNDKDTLPPVQDTIFTFDIDSQLVHFKRIYLSERSGKINAYYNGFSARLGDTIIINQVTTSDSTGTMIDIHDPENLKTAGTVKIPTYVRDGSFVFRQRSMYAINNKAIVKYNFESDGFHLEDTVFLDTALFPATTPRIFMRMTSLTDTTSIVFTKVTDIYVPNNATDYTSLLTISSNQKATVTLPRYLCGNGVNYAREWVRSGIGVFDGLVYGKAFYNPMPNRYVSTIIRDYRTNPASPYEFTSGDTGIYSKTNFPSNVIGNSILMDTAKVKGYKTLFIDSLRKYMHFVFSDSIVSYKYDTIPTLGIAPESKQQFATNSTISSFRQSLNKLDIRYSAKKQIVQIDIYRVDGKIKRKFLFKETTESHLDFSDFPNGLYLVRILADGIAHIVRFTKV